VFTAFAPLCLPRVTVLDGCQSIPRAYHAGGASLVDRAGRVGDEREFSTQCGAPLDPPNG
jgi:hypothetical protein